MAQQYLYTRNENWNGIGRKEKPLEILTKEVSDNDQYKPYSIVISNLQGMVTPESVQCRLYQLDSEGNIMKSEKGNPLGEYATGSVYENKEIYDRPALAFSSPIDVYSSMSEADQKANNSVKTLFNSLPSVFIWHNGDADNRCQFHGLHIHGIVYAPTETPLSQLQVFRKCKLSLKDQGLVIRSEAVRNETALLIHLQQLPRVVMGCNNLILLGKLVKTRGLENTISRFEIDEDQTCPPSTTTPSNYLSQMLDYVKEPVTGNNMEQLIHKLNNDNVTFKDVMRDRPNALGDGKKIPTTKTANKVDIVMSYMTKYGTTNMDSIVKSIIDLGYTDELNEIRSLMLVNNFQAIKNQAILELDIVNKLNGGCYVRKLIEECPSIDGTMTIDQTANVFKEWCNEQGIDSGEFLLKLYIILGKKDAKRNTFMLQGQSNAGKTYWTNGLTPFPDCIGGTTQSAEFAYQKCIGKDIIVIPELTLTKPEAVEELKQVMEGFPVQINIKNKEPKVLSRTPVLLQCNSTPWSKTFSQESQAFMNRLYGYNNLKYSMVLAFVDGKRPDPRFFQEVFSYLNNMEEKNGSWNYKPEHTFWNMYVNLVILKIEELTSFKQREHFTPTGSFESNKAMRELTNSMKRDKSQPESYIVNNLDRKVCTEKEFRDNLVAWIETMKYPEQGTMGINLDNIYKPVLTNGHDQTFLIMATESQKRTMQLAFADCNILGWRIDQWPSKIKTGMTQIDREKAVIKIVINGFQSALMEAMMNANTADIISISDEQSFKHDLITTPTKTSSIVWSDDDEIDGYKSEETNGKRSRTNSSDSDSRFHILNSRKRKFIKRCKKMKTSLKLAIPCIPKAEIDISYKSDVEMIPETQMSCQEKCEDWIEKNIV